MSATVLPTAPELAADPVQVENREGYEFVNGEWKEKHPAFRKEVHNRRGFEYVNGQWKEKNVSGKSSRVGMCLSRRVDSHADANNLGFVFESECIYQIHPDEPKRIRKPDFTFIRRGRFPNDVIPDASFRIAPDLATEIISPNDEAADLNNKVTEYLRAGVRLVWLVFPESRTVWVFRQNGTANWLMGDAELSGEDVLPGFSVLLPLIFADI